MNIKVPKNMKSPTVIIVGQGTADETKNDKTQKQMDLLSKKLDQQYQAFLDGTNYIKVIEKLHQSFMTRLDKLLSVNRNIVGQMNNARIKDLRSEFNSRIKDLTQSKQKDETLKSFALQLNSLENAIKNIPITKPTVRVIKSDNSNLNTSFERLFSRMEDLVRSVRPRLIPSPS